MGSANTSDKFAKVYKQFNLSQCSLTSVPVPDIKKLTFKNLFEYCVKVHNMIPIGVYKKSLEDPNFKPYVWLNPKDDKEKEFRITTNDELFVLTDKIPHANMKTTNENPENYAQSGKFMMKNEEKKLERENLKTLQNINKMLQDLFHTTKEMFQEVKNTNKFVNEDLCEKVKSDLYDEIK